MTTLTQPQAAQEQLRQQYLAAMGVTLWLPTQALPAAAPSPRWHWVEPGVSSNTASGRVAVHEVKASAQTAVTSAAGVEAARAAMAPLRQALGGPAATAQSSTGQSRATQINDSPAVASEAVARPVKSDIAAPPEVPQQATADAAQAVEQLVTGTTVSKEERPSFKLALITYSRCLVITELPVRHAQPWSDQHQQLLNAIMVAVGLADAGQSPSNYQEFHWPLDLTASYDQSEPVARHALEFELEKLQHPEQQALMLMGQSAAYYLLPAEQAIEPGTLVNVKGQPTLCCHGLNEVLRLPGLKAELWRQLQPLRQLPSLPVNRSSANPPAAGQ